MHETDISLKTICRCALQKGMGRASILLYNVDVSMKGGIERVTVMGVVSTAGGAYKPAIIFHGKKAWYCYVNGKPPTLHNYLSPCYVYQREPATMYSKFFLNWAKQVLAETSDLSSCGKYRLLVYDG